MGFISKVELRRQLMSMGVKLEGNYVRKSDISKLILADHASWEISLLQKVPTLKLPIKYGIPFKTKD